MPHYTSQKIISDCDDKLMIELFLNTTNDITIELLKYSAIVKIIEFRNRAK